MIRVWAPTAEKVELVVGNTSCPMTRSGNGWWSAADDEAGSVVDYAFRVDDSDPLPDPRSPWQPRGPHEVSRIYDNGPTSIGRPDHCPQL